VSLFFGGSWMAVLSGNVSVAAVGATVYVDDDNIGGPWDGTLAHPYQYIQDGINAASDGDTVHVLGGTYVENVVLNKSIALEGESKPVINGTTGHGIDITANNVAVEGFNITYSGYCIYTSASGFSIRNNVFWHDFDYDFYGIYWYISESSLAEDYTIHASVVEGNEFYMSGKYDAIYVDIELDYGSNSGYDVEIGDIQVCNNRFYMEGSTATGIGIDYIYVEYLYGGTVSFGALNMSGNTMYGGSYGIDFWGYLDDLQDVQASVGDVIINNNVLVNQSSYGMDIDYYDGTNFYGNTAVTYGDLVIRGNTITSETYSPHGIYLSDIGYWESFYDYASLRVGNVYIEENEIRVGGEGIYVYGYDVGYDLHDNSSFTMGHILVRDNAITSGSEGIDVYLTYFGSYMEGNASFAMGNIEFCGNVINSTSYGIYAEYIYDFGYEMYDNSTFTMGSIVMNNNTITSDYDGIDISYFGDFGEDMAGNSSFTMDNIQVNDNIINSGSDGIYVDDITYFAYYMEDNSSSMMGNIEFNGNIINSTNYGIYAYDLAYDFGYYMTGNSSFTMGHIQVNENVINSGYDGIYVEYIEYLGYYMYGESTFVMGNIEVSGNAINSTNYGIWLYEIDYFGYEMYNESSFDMGDFLVNDNIINSDNDGMYLEYIEYFGNNMYGNSSFTMGNVQINGNVINSTQRGIFIEDLYEFGYSTYGNSSFTMGNVQINGNVVTSAQRGICIYDLSEFGSFMHDTSSFTTGNIEISGNRINSTLEGIYIQSFYHAYYMYNNASFAIEDVFVNDNIINSKDNGIVLREIHHTRFGYNAIDNATIITGNVEFSQNEIAGGIDGIDLADLENATIGNNLIQNCSLGIYLQDSANNTIYHNNFINNTLQAYVRALYTSTSNCNNTWDNGYPSGGNYWSDYTGADLYSGPDQDILGSDFRGDTPYTINQNNTDHYPLTIPFETQPPTITILSPENTTYAVDTDIQLTFTLDEPVDWIGYSLNDQTPVTITGNITLPTLPVGWHHVTVYANDTFDNMGMSTVYFTVLDTTDPIANAGSDRTVNEDVSTTLDGSASTDNVGITGYTWTFTDVTVKTLTGDKPTYTFNNPGVYTITLNVTDAAGNWAIATLVITVLDVTSPVANAGENQTVNVGETVSFDAGDSTDNVGIVSYEWDFGDETSGTGKTATHEYTDADTYTVTLTVEDAAGNQATDTMVVTVNAAEAFPWWIVAAAGIVAIGIVVALLLLWRRRKKV
jgi:parallel beta-helix repeat protein